MPERNSGPLSITDGRDQAAGSLSGFAGSESFAETTAVGPKRGADCIEQCPMLRAKRKTYAPTEFVSV